jgi:hypothetical protein
MRRAIVTVLVALAAGILVGRFGPSAAGSQGATPKASPVPQGAASPVQSGYLNSYIALLRSDLRAKKTGIIAESLSLTAKESDAFWPIYKRYEGDLTKHYDARLRLIKDYADNYNTMGDAKAKELSQRVFALEEERLRLRREYFKQLEKVLPGKTLARFFMLERRIDLLVDLKIASEIPIVE